MNIKKLATWIGILVAVVSALQFLHFLSVLGNKNTLIRRQWLAQQAQQASQQQAANNNH